MNNKEQKISVFLVDDHPMVRDGLKSCLSFYEDIEVVGEAQNGHEALELSLKLKPDVILMDISMPHMNGIDITELMLERCENTKILILSMHDNPEFISSAVESGAMGYILKDAKSEEVYYAIKAIFDGQTYFSGTIAKKLIENPLQQEKRLTTREQEILSHIARGKTSKEIAASLCISTRTVEAHRRNIKTKLEIESSAKLIQYAVEHGLSKL